LFSLRSQPNAFSLHPCRRLKAALHLRYDLVDAEALGPLAEWNLLNVARNLATERTAAGLLRIQRNLKAPPWHPLI